MSKGPPRGASQPKSCFLNDGRVSLSVTRLLFGLLCPPFGSPLVTQALLSVSLGSRFVASALHRGDLASLKVPQRPLAGPKCTILYNETNDFAKTPVCQKCSLRAPLGPPRLPQGPPKAPQGPQGIPQEPLGGAMGTPSPPQRPPGAPSSAHGRQAKTLVLLT